MPPHTRVISDNDYAGDPDGLVQLAHHALSPSVELVGVLSSHLAPDGGFVEPGTSARLGAEASATVLKLAGRWEGAGGGVPVVTGSETSLPDRNTPVESAAAEFLVAEAMRDHALPLVATFGAGLTELATAYLLEPRIAERLVAVWIGGPEYPELADPPPDPEGPEISEYNERIDVEAVRVVFDAPIPLWQVPRDAYRQVLVSPAEIDLHIRSAGPLGAHLAEQLDRVQGYADRLGMRFGDCYILGDSPLVLLTALLSTFQPAPSSSRYVAMRAPNIGPDGAYLPNPDGRMIRVWTHLDNRLLIGDLFARLALHARAGARDPVPRPVVAR